MANIDYNNWVDLTQAVDLINPFDGFLTKTFFGKTIDSDTNKILYEINNQTSDGVSRLAVSNDDINVMKKSSKSAVQFTIPLTSESQVYSINDYNTMTTIGNYVVNGNNKLSAWQSYVLKESAILKERANRRLEMLAGSILETGAFDITENGVNYAMDFGYVPTVNTVTMTGTDLWTNAASDPHAQLMTYLHKVKKYFPNCVIVMGSTAASAFLANTKALANYDALNYRVGVATPFDNLDGVGGFIIAKLPDGTPIYQYEQTYTNAAGSTGQNMFDPKKVLIASPASTDFVQVRGSFYKFMPNSVNIQKAPGASLGIFAEILPNNNETAKTLTVQTLRCPIIKSPRACYVLKVIT